MRKRGEETALRSHITSFGFEAGVRSQYLLCGMPATKSIRVLSCWEMSDEKRHGDEHCNGGAIDSVLPQ
jgi:hypothetical protein